MRPKRRAREEAYKIRPKRRGGQIGLWDATYLIIIRREKGVTRFVEATVERTCAAGALWERERESIWMGWEERRGRLESVGTLGTGHSLLSRHGFTCPCNSFCFQNPGPDITFVKAQICKYQNGISLLFISFSGTYITVPVWEKNVQLA